ncbi:MAG: hypothetical protein U1E76_17205 [Planctomycetota bacterium]
MGAPFAAEFVAFGFTVFEAGAVDIFLNPPKGFSVNRYQRIYQLLNQPMAYNHYGWSVGIGNFGNHGSAELPLPDVIAGAPDADDLVWHPAERWYLASELRPQGIRRPHLEVRARLRSSGLRCIHDLGQSSWHLGGRGRLQRRRLRRCGDWRTRQHRSLDNPLGPEGLVAVLTGTSGGWHCRGRRGRRSSGQA